MNPDDRERNPDRRRDREWDRSSGNKGRIEPGHVGRREDEERFARDYRSPFGGGDEDRRQQGSERGSGPNYGYGGRGYDDPQGYVRGSYGAYGTEQGWGREGEERERPRQDERRERSMGERRGPHAGKGPRGYRRSDERIREDVSDALTRDPEVDATELTVSVEQGVITLAGTVEDRAQKRVAETVAERVEGVADVINQIRVQRTGEERGASPKGGEGGDRNV